MLRHAPNSPAPTTGIETARVETAFTARNQEDEATVLQGLEPILRIPDWRLTTAELLYHLPDHPHVLQSFVWQKIDLAPSFPELARFLKFWEAKIDGPLHSVRVASAALTRPAELRYANGVYQVH